MRTRQEQIDDEQREYDRLRGVIEKCRVSAGLGQSPDGPSGDVTNLLHRGDLAQRKAQT